MHRRASVLRTAQGIFASLPAAALLPGGTSRCREACYSSCCGCVRVFQVINNLLLFDRPDIEPAVAGRCMGKARNGRTSSRVESSTGFMSCHLSAEMVRVTLLFQRPVSCVQYLASSASSVQRPNPTSKMMQRNANSDFGVNCAQPECVQRVQSGAIMNHDVHTFFASRARVRTSSAALARRVCGTRDRGIALASSVLCCVLPLAVFEGRTRTSDFRLGVVTLASRRTVRHWVWHWHASKVPICDSASRLFYIHHRAQRGITRATGAAPSLKSQESSPESRPRNFARNARSVSISDRSFLCW